MSLADLREQYKRAGLLEREAPASPIPLFESWFAEAAAAGLREPNAMTLATASLTGIPSARIVLLKGIDSRGFHFYTNYESRKGREIEKNPNAALLFFWNELERQVRIEGTVTKLPRKDAEEYFLSRPLGSRLGAWASAQSTPIADREALEAEFHKRAEEFPGGAVPCPPFWGGYTVLPNRIEFWQGRPNRLHDRIQYTRENEEWRKRRLAP